MSYDLIDRLILHLGVPQKLFRPARAEEPELEEYPVEFNHLTRCLHRLGDNFVGYKIADIRVPSLVNAVGYCIKGTDQMIKFGEMSAKEICQRLGINMLIIGPADEQRQVVSCSDSTEASEKPYVILWRSYLNQFYPVVTLGRLENYLFYRKSNKLLQLLTPERIK